MKTKLNFPKNITAKSLYKNADHYATAEEINALADGRLVVAWDTPTDEDSPIMFYGFLKEILFSSDGSVKYRVFCPKHNDTFHFDTVKVVHELACPKVYYNDGELQGVGTLVGIKEESFPGKNADRHIGCRVRVAPWSETVYRTVGVDQLTFVENIPLGITEKDEKEIDDVH
jgi:hypothetical protein